MTPYCLVMVKPCPTVWYRHSLKVTVAHTNDLPTRLKLMDNALTHLQNHDGRMAALIDAFPKPEFKKHVNYYHELVDSIISQQLSVKAARTIEGRFKDL